LKAPKQRVQGGFYFDNSWSETKDGTLRVIPLQQGLQGTAAVSGAKIITRRTNTLPESIEERLTTELAPGGNIAIYQSRF